MADPLAAVLTEPIVASLATPRSYERGVVYLEEGRVGGLRVLAGRVRASVEGAETYDVELAAKDGGLHASCTCPVGRDGAFCKHCVAVALRWLRQRTAVGPTLDDARATLESLPSSTLIDLVIDHAHEDDGLARKLLLLAAGHADDATPQAAQLRALIDQAFATHGFVPYREVYGYARGIDETIDAVEALLAAGEPNAVIELAEHALTAAERALEHIDDSDGMMREVIERLEDLHLRACCRGTPDPIALAERLLDRELGGEWDVFDRAAIRYAGVLGGPGLARYRELAEARWASVPKLEPGDDTHDRYGARFRVTRVMEALAELSGNLAEQIAVRERDLSSGYSFLQIAELCRSHGDDDAALDWAQRGLAAFMEAPDARLRAFLIEEYRRRGRSAQALEQSLAAFAARPGLETYRELATDARTLGEWETHRAAALGVLCRPPDDEPAIARHPSLRGSGRSELVRILLWENDPDAAWQAACDGGCTSALWLQLADERRARHPQDALTVYRRHVEDIIAHKDKRSYAEAVALVDGTIRTLYTECDRASDFAAYIDELRAAHKPKRNLMKLIAELQPAKTSSTP
ncbi:MAG: hypothetical protein QOJ85_907 [Solirubrobacteraceae bacterium]|jgi:uncharacterized Zn finger protein|nr:hypothetical protein [Solirubrobacteraceae bacterium]